MAITTPQLSDLIEKAFNDESDVAVDPVQARKRQAQKIASAIEQYVIGRNTVVTGTSATGGTVTGTGIIQQ